MIGIAIVLLILLPATMHAQQLPTEDVVVRAQAESPAQQQAPTAFVTSIDPQRHAEQLETVTDALAESVGVQVRRFGGLGAFSTVSIRGSASNQVQVYFDGIPMSRARNETVNLADLPLDSLERIDVYRGGVPIDFGVAAIGGVVNLIPREPSDEPQSEVSASYGSFDTRKVVVSESRRIAGFGVLAHATYLGSEGDFTYFRPDRVADSTESPHQQRKNNAFNSVEGLFRVQRDLTPTARVDLTSELFFKNQGVPGDGQRQLLGPSFQELRSTNFLRLKLVDLVGGKVDTTTTLFGGYLNERFKDPDREFGVGKQDRDDETTVVGGSLATTWRAPFNNEVRWFSEVSGEAFSGFDHGRAPANRNDPDQRRMRVAVGLQNQLRLFDDRLTIVPTSRYEYLYDQNTEFDRFGRRLQPVTDSQGLWSPSIGAQLALVPWFEVRGNIARLDRAPNFSERFGNRGTIQGNPDLKTEKGILRDIGFRVRRPLDWLPEFRLEYAFYDNDIDDIIILDGSFNGVHFDNLDSARIRGHEVSLTVRPVDWFLSELNYTHQDAENRAAGPNQGNQLPLRPTDELFTRLQLGPERWQVYYEFNFVGQNYLAANNFVSIDDRMIHTAGGKLAITDWLSLGFEARNLGNDRAEDVINYPLPGRSFFGTIKATL